MDKLSILQSAINTVAQSSLERGVNATKPSGVADSLFGSGGVFESIANTLLSLLGAIAVIMLIIGGFRYVVSGGDSSAVEGAKNTILYAIIGIIVAFLSWAAVDFVIDQLSQGNAT
ncbi:MAG: hypothetical protein WD467_01995 [Candidatus Saccharimonadales bacterium]